ncbi:MAG: type II toxin-antitoxin system VapB family antitoxin [Rhizomicrobium sp.]
MSLDDDLIAKAREYSGLEEKSAIVHEALKSFVQQQAARRLARLGGSDPHARAAPRRRPKPA